MNSISIAFRQSTVDDLHGVYRMERELQGGKVEPVGAYESARLSRASASIADGAVRFGYSCEKRRRLLHLPRQRAAGHPQAGG